MIKMILASYVRLIIERLIIEERKIIFDIFKKPTNSERYLNFNSNLIEHKKSIIIGQFDRIIFLSHSKLQEKNIYSMIQIFLNNGYPIDLIFITIYFITIYFYYNRIKTLSHSSSADKYNDNKNNSLDDIKKLFTILYFSDVSKN